MTANVIPFARQRSLAHVLLDLAEQHRLNAECTKRSYAAYEAGDTEEEDRQGEIGSAIDDRISALQDEAKAILKATTGVSWDQLYEALA
jgi:hypothetical protein